MSNGQGHAPPANRQNIPERIDACPTNDKDTNKPSAKANFICILPRRVLSSTKIAKAESNYENLFLKIAEPHPVFCKDSQSREDTKIYFRRPGRPDFRTGVKCV